MTDGVKRTDKTRRREIRERMNATCTRCGAAYALHGAVAPHTRYDVHGAVMCAGFEPAP